MKEIHDTTTDAKEFLDVMKKGKIRCSPTSIATQTSVISNLLSTKLSTIKEITAVNSKISELELKKMAADNKNGEKSGKAIEKDNNLIIDKIFTDILKTDSHIGPEYDDEDDIDKYLSSDSNKKNKNKSIEDRIKELEESGDIEFTDTELAFKYESEDVRIVIYKNMNNNRWKFEALNADGEELYDYPLPDKKKIGKVKFDMEKLIATDGLNRTYEVIPVDEFDDSDDYLNKYTREDFDDDEDYDDE